MYSIASLFETDPPGPWQNVESLCASSEVTMHTLPHFSWQSADNYQLEPLKSRLTTLTRNIPSFKFHTSGLGVFSNDRKILFLIIVKTRPLLEMHEMLWNELFEFAETPKLHYSPENWIPHISINLNKLAEPQFLCTFSELVKYELQFEFEVNQFGLLYLNQENAGIDTIFPLKRPES